MKIVIASIVAPIQLQGHLLLPHPIMIFRPVQLRQAVLQIQIHTIHLHTIEQVSRILAMIAY